MNKSPIHDGQTEEVQTIQQLPPKFRKESEEDMNIFDAKSKKDLSDSFEELDEQLKYADNEGKRKVSAWTISLAVHGLVFFIFSLMVYATVSQKDYEMPPMQLAKITTEEIKKENTELPRKIQEEEPNFVIENEKADDNPLMVNIEDKPDLTNETDDDEKTKSIKGRDDAVAQIETGSTGFNLGIGVGSSGSGVYGFRDGGNKKKRTIAGYGPRARGASSAIDAGLRWLVRHQSPNGSWDAINYYKNCNDNDKCEPGQGATGDANIALTSYSCLSFLANGYDHRSPNVHRKVVEKGIEYIINSQKSDGSFGDRIYEHAITTQCISEALAMTNDPKLLIPATKAVKFLLSKSVNIDYNTVGWDYNNPNPNRIDNSIIGWGIFALKAAQSAGIDTKNSLSGLKYSIETSWKLCNPNYKNIEPYTGKSTFPYVWNSVKNTVEKDHLSFVAAASLSFLGHKPGDIMLDSLLNDTTDRFLNNDEYKNNAYALYYAALATFNTQSKFKDWSDKFVPYLLEIQYKTNGCKNGTFDYPNQKFHGWDTSRVLIHNYYLLTLSVVYRYNLISQK